MLAYLARRIALDELAERVCRELGVPREKLSDRGRLGRFNEARRALAYLWTQEAGAIGRELAVKLGLPPSSIHQAAREGRGEADRWIALSVGDAASKPNKL